MDTRLLTKRQVSVLTGLSNSSLWRYERDGTFPPRRVLPGGGVRWLQADVDSWMENLPRFADSRLTR